MRISQIVSVLACYVVAVACQNVAPNEGRDAAVSIPITNYSSETVSIATVNERKLDYYLDIPDTLEKIPLLLIVDGSSCIGQNRDGFKDLYHPKLQTLAAYARLRVEKPGVDPTTSYPTTECSEEFLKHYTIENRVIDHLRVMQHIRKHADWWNGELLIWGWSDGGDIAAQFLSYYPTVARAVLGAQGGGLTMAEHFKDYWVCSNEKSPDAKSACEAVLEDQFQKMADNPTWKETWSGHDNSWRVWPTRLNSRLSVVLQDISVPTLVVHGEKDYDSTPVDSARKLVDDLTEAKNKYFIYWEIPGMGHGTRANHASGFTAEHGKLVNDAVLLWLLTGETDAQALVTLKVQPIKFEDD